jgi:hypothetical protein
MNDEPRPADAARALRARGIDDAESFLDCGTPEQILAACHRWDRLTGVGKGLLVKWLRNGEFHEPTVVKASKAAVHQARFDEYAQRFPVGSIAEPHDRLQQRRWPDDQRCPGQMIVVDHAGLTIVAECDACQFEAAYPVRALHVLGGPYLREAQPPEEVF